ncbi:MAG TPA: hypothetical protein PKD26_07830 [Pyrinomonadaceae bacterium]|nr:hypothetical protein [Pyrinomonadaceae bacterium]
MGEDFLTTGRVARLVGVAVLMLVANVAVTVLYMVVYGHLIDPGHDQAYYDAHVQTAAPYCSVVAGIPLMFLAGWWVGRWRPREFAVRSALAVWFAYAVIDIAIILAAGGTSSLTLVVDVSMITKLAAAYFGAVFALRRAAQP